MKTVDLEVHGCGIKRYVMVFRGKSIIGDYNSFFSVGIESANVETAYDTFTNPNKRYYYEICLIERPEIMRFYTLKEKGYVNSRELFSTLADILVRYGCVEPGTPVAFKWHEFGKIHTRIIMNAGIKFGPAKTALNQHFDAAKALWEEFAEVPIAHDDAIDEPWRHFDKGTDRFEIWKWFEQSLGYSIQSLLDA